MNLLEEIVFLQKPRIEEYTFFRNNMLNSCIEIIEVVGIEYVLKTEVIKLVHVSKRIKMPDFRRSILPVRRRRNLFIFSITARVGKRTSNVFT